MSVMVLPPSFSHFETAIDRRVKILVQCFPRGCLFFVVVEALCNNRSRVRNRGLPGKHRVGLLTNSMLRQGQAATNGCFHWHREEKIASKLCIHINKKKTGLV